MELPSLTKKIYPENKNLIFFLINCKAWSNAKTFLLPLNFTFDKCLTISDGVLKDVHPEIQLRTGNLREAIVIK